MTQASEINVEVIDAVIREMGQLSADKALCSSLASKLRTHAPDLVEHLLNSEDAKKAALPFPPKANITALEATIFDNLIPYGGVRPKKGKGRSIERYKAVLKVWTCPVAEINFQSKRGCQRFEVPLQSAEKLIETAKRHEKSRHELAEVLRALATSDEFAGLGGALSSKPYGEGTAYHGLQVLMANDDMRNPSATFLDLQNKEIFPLPAFSRKDASGRSLIGNALVQSRYASDASLSNWRT